MIGLLGGVFSPVHNGHLFLADYVMHALGLEQVLFVPSGRPAHKRIDIMSEEDRLNMLRLAVAGNPRFGIWTVEIERQGLSYTAETIRQLDDPGRYCFITGSDIFATITSWRDHEYLLRSIPFAVASRPGGPGLSDIVNCVPEWYRSQISIDVRDDAAMCHLVSMPELEISSTYIRDALRYGKPLRYLLPDSVYLYLQEAGVAEPPAGG